MQQAHRLYKSRDDRLLFGVAGGHAEYFNIDPVIVRVGWVILTIVTGGIAAQRSISFWQSSRLRTAVERRWRSTMTIWPAAMSTIETSTADLPEGTGPGT